MQSTLQKWLMGLIGLGALFLVVTNPNKAAQGVKEAVGGTEAKIISGGRR